MSSGYQNWTKERAQRVGRSVLTMLAEKTQPKEIAITLGVSPSYVSRVGRDHGYRFRRSRKART